MTHPRHSLELGPPNTGHFPLEVAGTPAKGRGVFARVRLAEGDLIEIVPVIIIPMEQWRYMERTILASYVYQFGPEFEHLALALGYGSIYNHSYSPNARFVTDWEQKVIRYFALRNIEAGEEITINYNGPPQDMTLLDFEVKE